MEDKEGGGNELNESVSLDDEKKKEPALSKNQMKKRLRLERWAETKKDRRKKEREKIKERKKRLTEERRKQGLGLDEFGLSVKKTKMSDPEASDIKVAIDCAYDDLMSEPDIKKLIKQIQRCYAENRKSAKPLQLYLSSFRDKTKDLMSSLIQGYQNWDVHLDAQSPHESFGADSIVYLAAESPNVLLQLDPQKVYIIGGLVDHNHHKGVCFQRVTERGWSHAQLPIGDFVKLNSRKILAVNHVYEIILAYVQLGNWHDAFNQVLPNRKVTEFLSRDNSKPDSSQSPESSCKENPNSETPDSFLEDDSPISTENSRVPVVKEEESIENAILTNEATCGSRSTLESEKNNAMPHEQSNESAMTCGVVSPVS